MSQELLRAVQDYYVKNRLRGIMLSKGDFAITHDGTYGVVSEPNSYPQEFLKNDIGHEHFKLCSYVVRTPTGHEITVPVKHIYNVSLPIQEKFKELFDDLKTSEEARKEHLPQLNRNNEIAELIRSELYCQQAYQLETFKTKTDANFWLHEGMNTLMNTCKDLTKLRLTLRVFTALLQQFYGRPIQNKEITKYVIGEIIEKSMHAEETFQEHVKPLTDFYYRNINMIT